MGEDTSEKVNTYLIRGEQKDLLIDCGFDDKICMTALTEALDKLGCDLDRLDILLTHTHGDHAGLLPKLARQGTKIYVGCRAKPQIDDLRAGKPHRAVAKWSQWGLDEQKMKSFNAYREVSFELPGAGEFCYLHDGESLKIGRFSFTVFETPGHCEDHICLYDAGIHLLISGDMVIAGICPAIFSGQMYSHTLDDYLSSLKWLSMLDVDIMCPGHRQQVDLASRIDGLLKHHDERLGSVLQALDSRPKSAVEIAPKIKWHYARGKWEDFSLKRKLSAIGETFSHLEYLYSKKLIGGKLDSNGVWRFRLLDTSTHDFSDLHAFNDKQEI